MKVLVISDTHLTNRFIPKKYFILEELIRNSDKVIINGDFWDFWYLTFDQFINSQWKGLFPLLKQKDTVYVWGNHDPKDRCTQDVSLFSNIQSDNYFEEIDGNKYRFRHGHNYLFGKKTKFLEKYDKFIGGIEKYKLSRFLFYLIYYSERFLMRVFGPTLITKSKVALNNNLLLKERDSFEEWFIFGHTHGAEIDFQKKFINTGCIINHTVSYLLIENGEPRLLSSKY